MNHIKLPALSSGQEASWLGLLEVSKIVSDGWSLIGGQLVQLHCWERGVVPKRVTNDVDAVLDVRTDPEILFKFTAALKEIGFVAVTPTSQGHQHRWLRDEATIDVLIASGLGERASSRRGISGGTTLETPGGQGALDRAEKIHAVLGRNDGIISRPTLIGALIIKSAAFSNSMDRARDRHLEDIAILSTLLTAADAHGRLSRNEIARLRTAIGTLGSRVEILSRIENSREGLERLRLLIESEED